MKEIDILITSASRPDSLKSQIKAFYEHVKYDETWAIHLHEDVVPDMEAASKELQEYAIAGLSNPFPIFANVYVSDPRIGRGPALNKLRKHANSKYIWYMEEDFDFVKDIDLNSLIKLMDEYPHINQIVFNWRTLPRIPKPGGPNTDVFICEERHFKGGHTLHVSERWTWQPGLWRRSWVMPKWDFNERYSNKGFNRKLKANIKQEEWDPEWHEQNVGAYYYGSWNDDPWVKHTSWDIRHDREFL